MARNGGGCDPPALTVDFADATRVDHQPTTLTITLTRSDTSLAATGLGYKVTLPEGLQFSGNDLPSGICSGTLTYDYLPNNTVTLSGATIGATVATCVLQLAVEAPSSGGYSITNSDVSNLEGGVTNGVSTETLTVNAALPRLKARFNPTTVDVLESSTLRLTLSRSDENPTAAAAGLGYSITLPAGLVVGTAGVEEEDCGSAVTAGVGGTSIVLAGGSLTDGNQSCDVEVSIKATTGGDHVLGSGNVTVTAVEDALDDVCQSSVDEGVAQGEGCQHTLTADKLPQTLTFAKPADRAASAGPATLTASADSELPVTLTSNSPNVCTVNQNVLTPVGPGTCSITASQAGNTVFLAAEAVTQLSAITGSTLLPQTITFGQPASVALSAGTRALSASASSGLAIGYTSGTPLVCTVSGSTVTLLATGTCQIEARQAGNGAYAAATPVIRDFTVTRGTQTITFAVLGSVPLTQDTVTATAAASSGLTVVLTSSTPAVCTVSGRTITLVAGGTCTIAADQSGNAGYAAATTVSRSFTVTVSPDEPEPEVPEEPEEPAEPLQVTGTAGVSSFTVTWEAPSDTTGITGYTATASPGQATCTTTGATSCVMGGTAGVTYTVTVVAETAAGGSVPIGTSGPLTPTAPEPPAQAPVTDLTLTTDKGQITTADPGQLVVFIGTGFAAYSTVTISIYSEPIVLGTVVTDANGDFRKPITVPLDLVAGAHTAVAQGVAPDGSPRAMALAITVGEVAAVTNPPAAPGNQLAVTGVNLTAILLAGLASLAAGAGMLFGARPRRRRPASAGRLTA